jgi:hypothetical protein
LDKEEETEESSTPPDGPGSDLAKNIEIRRLSSTEDGDKIIEPAFHSPEKEAGEKPRKNPLEKILHFVSGLELGGVATAATAPDGGGRSRNNGSPALRGRKGGRTAYQPYNTAAFAPQHNSPLPWVLRAAGPQLLLPQQQQQLFQTAGHIVSGHQQQLHAVGTMPRFITAGPPPQLQFHQPAMTAGPAAVYGGQPTTTVMQLIQTMNGPVLVPLAGTPAPPTQPLYQLQQPLEVAGGGSSMVSKGNRKGGGGANSRKRKAAVSQSNFHSPRALVPMGVFAPGGQGHHQSIVSFLGPQQQQQQQQLIPFNSQGGGELMAPPPHHHIINLGQGANILTAGGVVGGPAQQLVLPGGQPAVVYQQLADGTLVQLPAVPAQQLPPPAGSPAAAPVHFFLNNSSGAVPPTLLATGTGGPPPQYIMTNQGLMSLPPGGIFQTQPAAIVSPAAPVRGGRPKTVRQQGADSKRPRLDSSAKTVQDAGEEGSSSSTGGGCAEAETEPDLGSEQHEEEESEEEEEEEEKEAEEEEVEEGEEEEEEGSVSEQASLDETDTSYEDVAARPSTSRKATGRQHFKHHHSSSSSIQSNKVDSSGLNATPPHQKDQGDFEQLRGGAGEEGERVPSLDTSFLDISRNSEPNLEEEDEEEEEDAEQLEQQQQQLEQQQQQQQQQQPHVSSSVKKKKKKKSADDYLTEQSMLYGE